MDDPCFRPFSLSCRSPHLSLSPRGSQRLTLSPVACRTKRPAGRPELTVRSLLFGLVLALAAPLAPLAAQPQIGSVEPRSLAIDQPQRLVIRGGGFDAATRLLSDRVLEQTIVAVEPGKIELDVVARGDAGTSLVWLVGPSGVSGGVPMAVDRLVTEPMRAEVAALPIGLFGEIRGNRIDETSFPAVAGQRVAIEVEARRFGAMLNPVVRIVDESGRQVAAAVPDPMLLGDSRAEFVAPHDGRYRLQLQDQLRRGANPGFYRLKIGDLAFADVVQPTAIGLGAPDRRAQVVVADGGAPISARLPEPDGSLSWRPAAVEAPLASSFPPRVRVAPWNLAIEERLDPSSRSIAAPVTLSGALAADEPNDTYRIEVPHGGRWTIELWSTRLGQTGDPVVDAAAIDGSGLGRGDDQPGTKDPRLDVTLPDEAREFRVVVSDLLGRSDRPRSYVLEISPTDRRRISAALDRDAISVSPNGTIVAIPLERTALSGAVTAEPSEPLNGIETVSAAPRGAENRLLVRWQATGSASIGTTRLKVTGEDGVVEYARRAEDVVSRRQPWLAETLAIAARDEAKFEIRMTGLTDDRILHRGGAIPVAVEIARGEGADGAIRLSLVTSQRMPRKIVRQDNQDREVDAIEQAIRLETPVTIPADRSSGEVVLLIPSDLAEQSWSLALVAERLGTDGQSVVGSAASPIVSVGVANGLTVLPSAPLEVTLAPGATEPVRIEGTIERGPGLEGVVVVTFDGLPDMLMTPEIELAPGETTFSLPLEFPTETTLERWNDLHLVARCWSADDRLVAESIRLKVNVKAP